MAIPELSPAEGIPTTALYSWRSRKPSVKVHVCFATHLQDKQMALSVNDNNLLKIISEEALSGLNKTV